MIDVVKAFLKMRQLCTDIPNDKKILEYLEE